MHRPLKTNQHTYRADHALHHLIGGRIEISLLLKENNLCLFLNAEEAFNRLKYNVIEKAAKNQE